MVGTGRIPILPKIAVVVGIDPKPGHDALLWSVVTENFEKRAGKFKFWPFLKTQKNHVFQFSDSHVAYGKKR